MRSLENDQQFIKILETIIECGSVSKASKLLFISQPSLSKKIKQQEVALGIDLLDRKHHPLRLTEAGEFYLSNLKRLILQYQAIFSDLTRMASSNHGQLSLGITQSLGQKILPKILPQFHNIYHEVTIHLTEDSAEHIENCLLQNKIDLYIGHLPLSRSGITYELLSIDPAYLIVPNRHPLFKAKQSLIKFENIDQIIPYISKFDFISSNDEFGFQKQILNEISLKGIQIRQLLHSKNMYTIAKLASKNLGCAIIPKSLAEEIKDLHPINLYELPHNFSYQLVIAYKEDDILNAQTKAFIKMAKGIGQLFSKI